mgnify:FL=1
MARPTKWRKIEHLPAVPYFVPAENDLEGVETNTLLLEEVEAIRLRDLEGLDQAECAKRMEVSRPTFQRILLSAREKMADALVNGKSIQISGGNYTRNICNVICEDCNRNWKESVENLTLIQSGKFTCPACGSIHIDCVKKCNGHFCNRNCWKQER